MKKIILPLIAMIAVLAGCEEWQPVFGLGNEEPAGFVPVTKTPTHTIAQLKALYGSPDFDKTKMGATILEGNIIIGGQIVSSDKTGNFYRSLYIQDESGAIEVKIGKTGMYNLYKLGQWLYVDCNGLVLGDYNGMLQIGLEDKQYATAYIDVDYVIDRHIFRGKYGTPVEPEVIDEAGITNPDNFGKLVRVNDLTYTKEIFCIIYDDADNSVYLSGKNTGVTTWAMSKELFLKHLRADRFGGAVQASDTASFVKAAAPCTVSQYFTKGKTTLQVRTSGYARFNDNEVPTAKVDLIGILSKYNANNQFTLLDDTDASVIVKQ